MRSQRFHSLSGQVHRYLRLFGRPRGQHLTGFGNLVRQTIPDATDTEILSVLRRLHRRGKVTLSKFVRCGPFFNVCGMLIQGGRFDGYDGSDTFFQGEFIVGLAA